MFILDADQVPTTLTDLTDAIDLSLRKWVQLPASSTVVAGSGTLPELKELTIDVSQGQIQPDSTLPFQLNSRTLLPGPTIQDFRIIGHPIRIAGIPVQFELTAAHASFAYARTPEKKLIATLQDASHGDLSIHLCQTDLDAAALRLARQFAGNAVTIQKVDVALNSVSPTEVNVLLTIAAKKFVTAIVRVVGRVFINDEMAATATKLSATSDGVVGKIAVSLLQPHLQKLEGLPLPLLAFSLGNVKLHAVSIHTTDGLQITAAFGSE